VNRPETNLPYRLGLPLPAARVTAWRATGAGPVAETSHPVHIAIVRPDGTLIGSAGDPDFMTPLRSCLKPIQAQALFLSRASERFAVSQAELALACASHEGAPLHTDTVLAFLSRLGLGVSDLMCGAHRPGDVEGIAALGDAAPTALHNNCSGKHTGMLAAALAIGAPKKDYPHAHHPVQALVRAALTALVPGVMPAFAVDGCSLPTPVMSVRNLALMYARFGTPPAEIDPTLATGLGRAFDAMSEHAELVGGRGVLDTRIMRSLTGVVAKRGADGGYAIAVRASARTPALGIGIKVESGSEEARTPAVLAVLDALGLMLPAARYALKEGFRPARKNHRGLVIGHWEAALELRDAQGAAFAMVGPLPGALSVDPLPGDA